MSMFNEELDRRLAEIRGKGLYRDIRCIDSPQSSHIHSRGTKYLNFSSNDYLGLANHSALKQAAIEAVEKFGAGAGASRLISGSLKPHEELESTIARFKGTDAALSFSSGYGAALGVIRAICGKDDVIVLDKLVHASIIDAARLSGAKLRVFAHNDIDKLNEELRWADRRRTESATTGTSDDRGFPSQISSKVVIITESVFSMDGDQAPLKEIVDLKDKFGAWLMVDEAHSTGLYGRNGRGLADQLGVSDRVEIQMGTLGKAVGAAGGFICGSRSLISFLINRARTFMFSTAPVPAAVAAAKKGFELIESVDGQALRQRLWGRVDEVQKGLCGIGSKPEPHGAIIPIMVGAEERAVEVANTLRNAGVLIPAIRYPTVARGKARLRMTVSASHTAHDVERAVEALRKALVK